ncbi:MAG: carbohydrate kinase family protein [Candidatus Peregrinibacteria bacterium]
MTKRPRTISIGGATEDLFVRIPSASIQRTGDRQAFVLAIGEKVRVSDVRETSGGGAANTSVGLSRLGCDAGFCGIVGSDQWGERLLETLRKERVDIRSAVVVEDEVSSFSIILTALSGDRTILYTPGANTHLHDATFDREAAGQVDWVYLNRIQDDSCDIQDNIVNLFRDKKGPGLTWNPGGCHITAGLRTEGNRSLVAASNLFLVNDEEALIFTGEPTAEKALRSLLNAGALNVCITCGKEGCIASDGHALYHCPIQSNVSVVETTGAGDAFGTGATWALLSGENLPTALKAGTMNAASVVGFIGAQAGLLTDIEIRRRLREVNLNIRVEEL